VAANLKQLGFEVKLVLNPSSREMKSALNEVVYGMGNQKNRALLFYYAGHGETLELADGTKLGYIITSDCPLKMKDPMGFDDKLQIFAMFSLSISCFQALGAAIVTRGPTRSGSMR